MEEKAQTSIETLLIIASAVVIAVVVGAFLKSIVTGPIAHRTNELANWKENVYKQKLSY